MKKLLIDLAGDAAEGVLGSMLFTPPGEGIEGLADAEQYLASRGDSLAANGLLYGQGWTMMRLMVEGVRRAAASGDLSGSAVKAAFESIQSFDTGGVTAPVTWSADNHWGVDAMRIDQVSGTTWVQTTDLRSPKADA